MSRRKEYEEVARGIARYLGERQRPDGSFPGPDHYGTAFALLLWSHFGKSFAAEAERARQRLAREPPQTHGEFNAYARLGCREEVGPSAADGLLRRVRFGGRHSANWMLLRAVCRAQEGPWRSPMRSSLEARASLLWHARRGFIADRKGVRSFGYHAFCGALLAELWRHRGWTWAGRAAVEAAGFLARFVLRNGDTLYVGRGQQQIFGYGALLYLLEAAGQIGASDEFEAPAERVFSYLRGFRREDGSFPLVLREGEPAEPWEPDASRFGWYTYNRYADYLPFLGAFLVKAAKVDVRPLGKVEAAAGSTDFRRWKQDRYEAVIARPGGRATNDMAFPYVCVSGESLFPCYGREGEEVGPEEMPLPYGRFASGEGLAFRKALEYEVTESGLAGRSALVFHNRSFEFGAEGFTCRDEIRFRRACEFAELAPANFLFKTLRPLPDGRFETRHGGARAVLSLRPAGEVHAGAARSASGPLVALRHTRRNVSFRGGDRVTSELEVRFR